MVVHFLAIPALKAAAVKALALYKKYKAVKSAAKVFDWAAAHVQLASIEKQYAALLEVPMAQRNPKYDLRTSESGGPAFRKAIRDSAAACAAKDDDMFQMVMNKLAGDLAKHGIN